MRFTFLVVGLFAVFATASSEGENANGNPGQTNNGARSFGFSGFITYPKQQQNQNGQEENGRRPRTPPNERCPEQSPFPSQVKCKKGSPKDKDKNCQTKECIFIPTVGYTVRPSYFNLFNIPSYYRYMFSKQIINPNPFNGLGGLSSPFQNSYSQFGGYQQQQSFSPYGGQYQHQQQHGQGFPATGGQTSYPSVGVHPPYNLDSGYNPYYQDSTKFFPIVQNPAPFPVGQFQSQNGFVPPPPPPPTPGDAAPLTRMLGLDYLNLPNSGTQGLTNFGVQPQQPTFNSNFGGISQYGGNAPNFGNSHANFDGFQQQHQYGSQIIGVYCRRPGQVCKCKSDAECECSARRIKSCTQQYTDAAGYFWIYEWVPNTPPASSHQTSLPTDQQEVPFADPILKSGEHTNGHSTVQQTTYSSTEYGNQQPAGSYQLRQKYLYYQRPSGCSCEANRRGRTQSTGFFG